MISPSAQEALQRLCKGKYKLSERQLRLVLQELQSTSIEELLVSAFPPKQTPKRKPAPAKPQWLKDMISAQKKLAWKAAEATDQLYQIAQQNGFRQTSAKQKSFPKAAEAVAAQLGSSRTRDAYIAWVERYQREHKLI